MDVALVSPALSQCSTTPCTAARCVGTVSLSVRVEKRYLLTCPYIQRYSAIPQRYVGDMLAMVCGAVRACCEGRDMTLLVGRKVGHGRKPVHLTGARVKRKKTTLHVLSRRFRAVRSRFLSRTSSPRMYRGPNGRVEGNWTICR